MKWRKLEDDPKQLDVMRELLAKRLGLPVESEPTIWQRVWKWLRSGAGGQSTKP